MALFFCFVLFVCLSPDDLFTCNLLNLAAFLQFVAFVSTKKKDRDADGDGGGARESIASLHDKEHFIPVPQGLRTTDYAGPDNLWGWRVRERERENPFD